MSDNNFKKEESKSESKNKNNFPRITELVRFNKYNKYFALLLVGAALILSLELIKGMEIQRNAESEYIRYKCSTQETNSATSEHSTTIEREPIKTIESTATYSNTQLILSYICILVFVSLSLWGTFTILLKALKFENNLYIKIFDLKKDIYKEAEMWELTLKKKEYESKEKEQILDYRMKELAYKKNELEFRKDEFNSIEKVKLEITKRN